MSIDATHLCRCIGTLETALGKLDAREETNDDRDLYRWVCVKEFERVLEQSGKLLRKRLAVYFATNRSVDRLTFKDLFRHAARHDLMDPETVERWLEYRDNSDEPANELEAGFSEATLTLLPAVVDDANALCDLVERGCDD